MTEQAQEAAGAGTSPAPPLNPNAIAILRWYPMNVTAGIALPQAINAGGIAFDGANMWVTGLVENTVSKVRASDGAFLGTFKVGTYPNAVAFDGANVWVVNTQDNTVTKVRASDGKVLGTFQVGKNPLYVVFDGAYIWVSNGVDNTVMKLRVVDGKVLGTFGVTGHPGGMAFDGANVWVGGDSTVSKVRASDGQNLGTFASGGDLPTAIAFDGQYIWVANSGSSPLNASVVKLRPSDGVIVKKVTVNEGALGAAFDGANVWITIGGLLKM